MISIIVSTYRENLLKDLTENLQNTITVPYELIPIVNHNKMSLTQAYNLGASKASFDYLCFMHEDLKIHTHGWVNKLVNFHQSKANAGIIGIAGSKIRPDLPTGIFCFLPEHDFYYGKYHSHNGHIFVDNIKERKIVKVKVLDGVFLFTHRDVWKSYPFNEKIEGFHFYDIDFSLRISESFQNFVTTYVLIEHFSPGSYGVNWITAAIKFDEMYSGSHLLDKVADPTPIQNKMYRYLSAYSFPHLIRLKYIKLMGWTRASRMNALYFLGVPKFMERIWRVLKNYYS